MSVRANKSHAVVRQPRHGFMPLTQILAAVPTALLALVPTGTCPLCVAGNVGVMSGLGVPFLLNHRVQTPLIVVFLAATLGCVGWVAMKRRSFAPFVVVLVGSLALGVACFAWNHSVFVYGGSATILGGALWSTASKPRSSFTTSLPGSLLRTSSPTAIHCKHDTLIGFAGRHVKLPRPEAPPT